MSEGQDQFCVADDSAIILPVTWLVEEFPLPADVMERASGRILTNEQCLVY
jgi:hypothetical protein